MPNPAHARFIDRLRVENLDETDASIAMYTAAMARSGSLSIADFHAYVADNSVETVHNVKGISGMDEIDTYYSQNLESLPVFGPEPVDPATLASILTQLAATDEDPLGGPLLHLAATKVYALIKVFEKFWVRTSPDTVLVTSTVARFELAKGTGDYANFILLVALRQAFCRRDSAVVFGIPLTCVEINDLAQFFRYTSSVYRSQSSAADGPVR
jgi:hypothetical protein